MSRNFANVISLMYDMRKGLIISSLLILASVLFQGCGERRVIRKTMKEFTSSTICLPERMLQVYHGKLTDYHHLDTSLTFIEYYGPESCSSCAVSHLPEERDLFRLCDSIGHVTPLIIFSPSSENEMELISLASKAELDFPIYIDQENCMNGQKTIPNDMRFHYFLIDRDRRPVFVGHPLKGTRLKELFVKICEQGGVSD